MLQGIRLTGCPLSNNGQRQAWRCELGTPMWEALAEVVVARPCVCCGVCWLQVTENGVPVPNESEKPLQEALRDNFRLDYYR